jgi:hypothetical protein
MPHILTAQEQVLSALPGIGPDRARDLLTQFGTPALALMGLTDPNWEIPNIKGGIKNKVRSALKLAEGESLVVTTGPDGREWVDVNKSFIQEKVNE